MDYIISFLEGIITFISPCMLPMLPIYITYFAGGNISEKKNSALRNSVSFVIGFSVVYILLGLAASSVGVFLKQNASLFNILGGLILIIFGLNYIGIIKFSFLNVTKKFDYDTGRLNFFSSLIFGVVFSIGWTPCVGAFLGSALMLAANATSMLKGAVMLASFSLGLGIPFILSAVLLDQLKGAFNFIKRNYKIINIVSGSLLILIGILMMFGLLNLLLGLLTF